MLKESFRAVKHNSGLYAFSLAALVAIYFAANHGAPSIISVGALPVFMMFQFLLIRKLLDAEPGPHSRIRSFIVFGLKNVIFGGFALVVATVFFGLQQAFAVLPVWLIAMIMAIYLIVGWVFMVVLFGSWLPAGMNGRETSLREAFRRGRQSFLARFVTVLLLSLAIYLGASIVPFAVGFTHPTMLQENGSFWLDLCNIASLPIQLLLPVFWAVHMVDQYQRTSVRGRTKDLIDVF